MTSGDVVLLHFPFSDLSGSKLRPAMVLAAIDRGDFIACQITSNRDADPEAVELTAASFAAGSLRTTSYARPGKLFTAHQSIVARRVAQLSAATRDAVKVKTVGIIQRG
jgi:mRNA interferase MazF